MGEIIEMGSAKHRWWKEAVVYQVLSPPMPSQIDLETYAFRRSIQHHFNPLAQVVFRDGATSRVSSRNSIISNTSAVSRIMQARSMALSDDWIVDVVWLSPIYKSPQVDMGYDIVSCP